MGHHLRQEFLEASHQEIADTTCMDRHEQQLARRVHQIFQHTPWAIPNLQYVKTSDIQELSSRWVDHLEEMVAEEAQSTIPVKSEEVQDLWNPLLEDNPDQFIRGLIALFQGPPLRIHAPQNSTDVPYFVEENLIDWRLQEQQEYSAPFTDDDIISGDIITTDITPQDQGNSSTPFVLWEEDFNNLLERHADTSSTLSELPTEVSSLLEVAENDLAGHPEENEEEEEDDIIPVTLNFRLNSDGSISQI